MSRSYNSRNYNSRNYSSMPRHNSFSSASSIEQEHNHPIYTDGARHTNIRGAPPNVNSIHSTDPERTMLLSYGASSYGGGNQHAFIDHANVTFEHANVTFDQEVVETEIDNSEFPPEPGLLLEALSPTNQDRELLVLALAMMDHGQTRGADEDTVVEALLQTAENAGMMPEEYSEEELEEGGEGEVEGTEEEGNVPRRSVPIEGRDITEEYTRRKVISARSSLVRASFEDHRSRAESARSGLARPSATTMNTMEREDDEQRMSALERLEEMVMDPDIQAAFGWMADYENVISEGEESEGPLASRSMDSRRLSRRSSRSSNRIISRQGSRRGSTMTARMSIGSKVGRSRKSSLSYSLATAKDGEDTEAIQPYRMSAFFGFFNLVNDVATSSIVSVPYFVIVSGLPTGLLMLTIMPILGHFMLLLLHRLTLERNLMSFVETCYLALGLPGYLLATIAIFIFNFGGFVSGLIMIAGMVPGILSFMFGDYAWFDRTYVLLAAMILLSPLAFKKHLASLNIVSALSVSIAIFLVVGVIVHASLYMTGVLSPDGIPPSPAGSTKFFRSDGALNGIGGLGYLFACHDLAYHISTTLEDNTMRRYAVVSGLSMYIPMAMLAAMSVCAWMVFGDKTEANILDSYGEKDTMAFILRSLLSLNVIFNIPYTIYMPRVAILSLIQLRFPHYVLPMPNHSLARNIVHYGVTIFLLITGFLIAKSVSDLGIVFGLVGGISGIAISMVLPAACWLRMGPKVQFDFLLRATLWVMLLFGSVVMVVTCIGPFMD